MKTIRILSGCLALSLILGGCDTIQDGLDGKLGENNTTTTEVETTTTDNTTTSDTPSDTIYRDSSSLDSATADRNDADLAANRAGTGVSTQIDASDDGTLKDMQVADDRIDESVAEPRSVDDNLDRREGKSKDMVQVALLEPELSTFHQLMTLADLDETLAKGQYTLLAPSNTAFRSVPKAQMDALRQNKTKLRQVLMFHLLKSPASAADLGRNKDVQTLFSGRKLAVTKAANGKTVIQQANLVKPDIWTTSGMVHIIDRVLIPNDLKS